jgi:hypothetical protein
MKKYLTPLNVTIAFVITAVLSPFLLTQGALHADLIFTDTGAIGDTVGGLTAPVIGLLNAVLLYWTLKRQEDEIRNGESYREQDIRRLNEQRDEDNWRRDGELRALAVRQEQEELNSHYLRVIASVDSKIKSLYLPIEMKEPVKDEFKYIGGEHHGPKALLIASELFSLQIKLLHVWHVSIVDWVLFANTVNEVVIEVELFLSANDNSRITEQRKQLNFVIVMAKMKQISGFYNNVEAYAKEFPELPALKDFFVSMILKFKPFLNSLSRFDRGSSESDE